MCQALYSRVRPHQSAGGSRTPHHSSHVPAPHPPPVCIYLPFNSCPFSSQQKNQLHMHLVGAFFALFLGNSYFWLQLILVWYMRRLPQPGAPWIGPLRLGLCSLCSILLVTSILPGAGGRGWSGGWSSTGVVHLHAVCSRPQSSGDNSIPGSVSLGEGHPGLKSTSPAC